MSPLQTEIEKRLAASQPDIEVLLAEVLGGRCLRVYIDHPDGVTLAMCERVTAELNDLRERYSLEGLLARQRASLDQACALPPLRWPARTGASAPPAADRPTRN